MGAYTLVEGDVTLRSSTGAETAIASNPLQTAPTANRQVVHNDATLTTSGSASFTHLGYGKWFLVINRRNAPSGTSPTLQFQLDQVDPLDPTTVVQSGQIGAVQTDAGVEVLEIKELRSDTVRVSWTVAGTGAQWTGVNATLVGHPAGTGIAGVVAAGQPANESPVVVGGVDGAGNARRVAVNADGQIQAVITTAGVGQTIAVDGFTPSRSTLSTEWEVPPGKTFKLTNFYVGGSANGNNTSLRASLSLLDPLAFEFVPNGDFESGAEVAAWCAVSGAFTAPSPDSSSAAFQSGAAAMRWIYTSSATAHERKQTFAQPIDLSGWRYVRARFYNDGAVGTTRTLSIVLWSGTASRTYSVSGTLGDATLPSNSWLTVAGEIENPNASAGSSFDLSAVTAISVKFVDGAHRSGTAYWDQIRFEESITQRHRIFTSDGSTVNVIVQPEKYLAGGKLLLAVKNTGTSKSEICAIASGVLEDA